MKRELKVYSVNDMDWWVTDTLDNLKIAYEEQTGEKIDEDVLEECDLDKEGMYWSFDNIPENCYSHCDTYSMHVTFRRALELDGAYEKPHLLSTTWY